LIDKCDRSTCIVISDIVPIFNNLVCFDVNVNGRLFIASTSGCFGEIIRNI